MNNQNKPFGYVYDERMLEHECAYDPTMAEKPERMKLIYERILKEGQFDGATKIEARPATDAELEMNHPRELIDELEALQSTEQCEEWCRDKEILWVGEKSMEAARLAAGSSIDIIEASVEGKIGNGFAIVRPPGHHSWGKLPQGYCIFNNVALAAKYAVQKLGVPRVAVIDFDIHPGNGTYMSLRDDPRIHFTSFHTYQHGAFWPFQKQFDYDSKKGQLFFPLNGAMNTEGDYASAFHHVLLPVLREFKPELIIISAGFDAAYFDIMLDMGQAVKAHGYGHMARQLAELCPGRTVAILEGGYFPHSYVECAHMMVKGLQGAPLPALKYPDLVSAPFRETLLNIIHHHANHWECMKKKLAAVQEQQRRLGLADFTPAQRLFLGQGVREHWDMVKSQRAVRTREWFPPLNEELTKMAIDKIDQAKKEYDYSIVSSTPSEGELLSQLVWDELARAESYIMSAPAALCMYNDYHDYRTGKKDHMMICDRELLAKKSQAKLN